MFFPYVLLLLFHRSTHPPWGLRLGRLFTLPCRNCCDSDEFLFVRRTHILGDMRGEWAILRGTCVTIFLFLFPSTDRIPTVAPFRFVFYRFLSCLPYRCFVIVAFEQIVPPLLNTAICCCLPSIDQGILDRNHCYSTAGNIIFPAARSIQSWTSCLAWGRSCVYQPGQSACQSRTYLKQSVTVPLPLRRTPDLQETC